MSLHLVEWIVDRRLALSTFRAKWISIGLKIAFMGASSSMDITYMNEPLIADEDPRVAVWAVLAQFWVDTWYDAEQLDAFADRLSACGLPVRTLDRIVHWDVCGGFACFSLSVFATAGMALPDWYYPEELAIQQIRTWVNRPKFFSLINPAWIVGYFAARWFISDSWTDLRARIIRRMEDKPR